MRRLARDMVAADEALVAVDADPVVAEAGADLAVAVDAEVTAAVAAEVMDVLAKADLAAVALVAAKAASGNISARRKFADSAWIKWILLITRRPTCCSNLCRNAASFCPGGSREHVRVTSVG